MNKLNKFIVLFLVLGVTIISLSSFSIYKIKEIKLDKELTKRIANKEKYFAIIEIPKINLKREIYNINDKRNNVKENILVHSISVFPKNIVLAAHSGKGSNAHFKNLYKLSIGDEILIYYQDKIYKYLYTQKEVQNKTGKIYLNKEYAKDLILITCSRNSNKTQDVYYNKLTSISDI